MGRKRKQIGPGVVTNLPPCRVCGAPGAGLHYGVNTCEACKGFFHRSLKIWTQYKCERNEHCTIEPGRSKLCQLCRYQRCLAAGMAKEAIKTGRYTCMKRTNDILEIRLLQEKQTISTEPVDRQSPKHETKTGQLETVLDQHALDCDSSQVGKLSSQCGNTSDQFSAACVLNCIPGFSDPLILCDKPNLREAPSLKQDTLVQAKAGRPRAEDCEPNEHIQTSLDNTSLHGIDSLLCLDKQGLQQLEGQQLQEQFLSGSSSLTPLSVTSGEEMTPLPTLEEAGSVRLNSCPWSETLSSITSLGDAERGHIIMLQEASKEPLTSISPKSVSTAFSMYTSTSVHSPSGTSANSPELSLLSPVSLASSPAVTHSAATPLLQADIQDTVFDSTSDDCSVDSVGDFVSEIYRDKDMIIRTLVAADEASLIPVFGHMRDEEILQQQLEHLEACRLKTEMFGQLTKLPDHEYDYIYVTTGLDTDDRQKLLNNMGECLETMIRAMVKFCKAIPGFSRLHINDRIQLIKYSRQEFYIFITYKCVDPEKRMLRGIDCQWKCQNELLKAAPENTVYTGIMDAYLKFCFSIRGLKLSYQELVVIRALIVMAPDRDKPVHSPLAHEIRWQLTLCLIHLLAQRYANPFYMFARIMDRLTEARTQTENVIFFLRNLKIDKYSHLMFNPLLKEMFGGIFFNNDDDELSDDI
ncbi:hypothetical protein BsWGS_17584 [Bradybaena similaris]